jgi:alkanesulfonate monooxygenase SsuD/methylene tetrahydromethanopterin reductase-like flavin-dependent oxidoreductase (luciferase family)
VTHDGEFYRIPASHADPKPVRPGGPPILLGGLSPGALDRAGRIADGWISSSRADLATIDQSVAAVRRAAEKAGRDPGALRFICRGVVLVRESRTGPLTGSLDEIRADIAALGQQGITEVFIDLNFDPEIGSTDADPAASMARAEDVIAALAP